jgi:thiosulfate/3-mercaptopyruvate sulfurtransferase
MSTEFTTLIDVAALRRALASPTPPLLLDSRFDLTDPAAGERDWRAAHLPASHYVHLERDLCAPPSGHNGRHPLPGREDFARTLGRLGVTPAAQVVVVDAPPGIYAARLWWMLRWAGHRAVAVLDGGVPAWTADGGALVADPPAEQAAAPYPLGAPLVQTVQANELQRALGTWRLIDARAAARFRGDVEPLDARAGHIPGAVNRFFADNLDAQGRFKPPARLREEFTALVGLHSLDATVHSCGSGVSACHNLLAMAVAEMPGARLYPGSWSEWSADPTRPVAQGG